MSTITPPIKHYFLDFLSNFCFSFSLSFYFLIKMRQMGGEAIDDGNDDGIRSIEGSEWTLETTSIGATAEDGNAQGNEGNSINALLENSLDRHRRVPLPLELNCQIFECLKFGIQRKFIGGLGRGIYAIFRHKVLTKTKRLQNPEQNGWEVSKTYAIISSNGLVASDNTGIWQNIIATKGFPRAYKFSRPKKGFPLAYIISRTDNFPGTILYYFEVTIILPSFRPLVGLASQKIPNFTVVGYFPNSYAIPYGFDYCWLSDKPHDFEWPNGATKPQWNGPRDVIGCGLVLTRANELSIFFTGNGILMGKQIPINPTTVNPLYPTVTLLGPGSVEANFGNDLAKPFCYDIQKCPGMAFK